MVNPLLSIPEEYLDSPHMYITWLMTQPEYFSFICAEILNVKIFPTQALMLHELWHRKFPMLIASRGFGKSFTLALYALLRILLLPNRKIVIAGAAFRQSKIIFDYMESIYKNAPVLRDLLDANDGPRRDVDTYRFHIKNSTAYAIPIGDGSKIRGLRANDVISDEFASIPKAIFETVLAGFAVVNPDPVGSMQEEASIEMAKEMGVYIEDESDKYVGSIPNQIVISGTADYDFKHFADYWKKWHKIITSKGQSRDPEDHTNYEDYSIIRIPYKLVPKGFMDQDQIARSRATVHTGVFEMEYGAVFSKDSSGFYKRTLIETCCVNNDTDWSKMPAGASKFEATLTGDTKKSYVLSVDPASESDNFSITILEMHETHRRIVYCWVTNAKEHAERIRMQLSTESDFYAYCCRKIRDLMKVFPCERIVIDGQGGGKAVIEGLHDKDKMEPGEQQLWHVIDPDETRDSDGYSGQHIIIEIQFANSDWTVYANTGLRKDFEDKVVLFPYFDPVTLSMSSIDDEKNKRIFDTLEDCVVNIEELKNELTTIVMTSTPGGNRDRWDTPEIKLPGSKKGRMRKDRYSALLMANAVARQLQRLVKKPIYISEGGFAERIPERPAGGHDFAGPAWFTEKMRDIY